MLPRKIKQPKTRQSDRIRCPGHLAFVRSHECCVTLGGWANECFGSIEAAHVRTGTNGGVGIKPGDEWTVSLCYGHHDKQHRIGEREFEATYLLDMKKLAAEFAAKSDPLRRYLARKRAA